MKEIVFLMPNKTKKLSDYEYYRTENGVLYCGDCKNVMKEIDSSSIDTIITDPPYGLKFMGKKWDYDIPSIDIFKEMLRVLKPGGTLLCFAGSRTQHRMGCNIEDAGFGLKDCIMWLYGSGFPKATDISKQIDKMAGVEREVINEKETTFLARTGKEGKIKGDMLMAETKGVGIIQESLPATPEAKLWNGWKSHGLKPSYEPIIVAMKPNEGSYAENALKHGVSGLNIDGGRIGSAGGVEKINIKSDSASHNGKGFGCDGDLKELNKDRFPTNVILDEAVAEMLDEQSGNLTSGTILPHHIAKESENNCMSGKNYTRTGKLNIGDSGGASRFFKTIFDNTCFLCYNTFSKAINKENILWKLLYVKDAEKNLKITQATRESIVPLLAMQRPNELLVQNVKSAGNLCDLCAIHIAHELVKIKTKNSGKASTHILDYMQDYKRNILIQNLVNFAELWENIDITPTIQNLLLLFGSVNHAITNYTPEIKKSEPKRFLYTSKASKDERNAGCEGLKEKDGSQKTGRKPNSAGLVGNKEKGYDVNPYANGTPSKNFHPTIKPISLMEYLCKLTKTPTGGVVLDPFAGSCTTGIACENTGRKSILIEREKEYCEIGKRRLQNIDPSYLPTEEENKWSLF